MSASPADAVHDGVVREWHREEGWGVIDSADAPGGCWASFGDIAADGYRELTTGQAVEFRFEQVQHDEFRFQAVKIWNPGAEPDFPPPTQSHGAMSSTLTIVFDKDPRE